MRDFLKGKKTYLVAFMMVIVHGLYYSGKIDKTSHDMLVGLLGAGAVATVSAKINRLDDKVY